MTIGYQVVRHGRVAAKFFAHEYRNSLLEAHRRASEFCYAFGCNFTIQPITA